MKYKVVEVNSGICTGTLRKEAVEKAINDMALAGWKFEHADTIIGRFLLIFPRYKLLCVFSREN